VNALIHADHLRAMATSNTDTAALLKQLRREFDAPEIRTEAPSHALREPAQRVRRALAIVEPAAQPECVASQNYE
jgi:hypothetical protein